MGGREADGRGELGSTQPRGRTAEDPITLGGADCVDVQV